jgi:hypothetical protein
MAFLKKTRQYFFSTFPLNTRGKQTGFKTNDEPNRIRFEELMGSIPFFTSEDDRARYNLGGEIKDEVGLVAITTDAKAKSNTSGLEADRTLVPTAKHLPTVVGEEQTIDALTDELVEVEVDIAVTTRNNFIVRLKASFITWLEALKTAIDGILIDIGLIQADIITIQEDITTIQGDITTIEGDITTLQGDVTTLQGDVINIQGDITTIQGDISTIEGDITTINNTISGSVVNWQSLVLTTSNVTLKAATIDNVGGTLAFSSYNLTNSPAINYYIQNDIIYIQGFLGIQLVLSASSYIGGSLVIPGFDIDLSAILTTKDLATTFATGNIYSRYENSFLANNFLAVNKDAPANSYYPAILTRGAAKALTTNGLLLGIKKTDLSNTVNGTVNTSSYFVRFNGAFRLV